MSAYFAIICQKNRRFYETVPPLYRKDFIMEEKIISCSYCWESIRVYLEPDIGEEKITIIEDCSVCCRPIELTYSAKDAHVELYDYHAIEWDINGRT